MGAGTWSHCPTVEFVPPGPPSATYRFPSGPNLRPRGLLNPVAMTETVVDAPALAATTGLAATGEDIIIAAKMLAIDEPRRNRWLFFI